jgi:hypothetical protein
VYNGILDALNKIVEKWSLKGFYKGLGPSCLQDHDNNICATRNCDGSYEPVRILC